MEIPKRTREELKSYFVKNSIPSASNFAELIEGCFNQRDDGVVRLPGDPLSIEAAGDATSQKKSINFYLSFADAGPSWTFDLNPRTNPGDPTSATPGFNIADGEGNSRLFIDRGTGKLGLGTSAPNARLQLKDTAKPDGPMLRIGKGDDSGDDFTVDVAAGQGLASLVAGATIRPDGKGYTFLGKRGASRIVLHDGKILLCTSDATSGTAGQNAKGLELDSARVTIDGTAVGVKGDVSVTGALAFGAKTRQMLNLSHTQYGIGVQSSTQYARTAGNFAWYKGGAHNDAELHPGGGSVMMVIKGGRVGIGTSNPKAKVAIQQGSTPAASVAAGKSLFVSGPTSPGLEYDGGIEFRHDNLTQGIGFGYQAIYATGGNANQPLHVYARGSDQLTLNAFGGGNVGIGIAAPIAKLDVCAKRTDSHPASVTGLYVTGDFGPAHGGVEFRHTNGTQGIGFGYNTIYATGGNTNQDLGLKARGSGSVAVDSNLRVGGGTPLQRIVAGRVNANGSKAAGAGFTSKRLSKGKYAINFSPAFSSSPVVVATCNDKDDDNTVSATSSPTSSRITLFDVDPNKNANPEDGSFSFIAIAVG